MPTDNLPTAPSLERFADRLKQARQTANLTQAELADAAGVQQPTVAGWEQGQYKPNRVRLAAIARAVNRDPRWLEGYSDVPDDAPFRDKGMEVLIVGKAEANSTIEGPMFPLGKSKPGWKRLMLPFDQRYPGAARFGLEVRGSSTNKILKEGSLVICVRFSDIGRFPMPEELVVVQTPVVSDRYEITVRRYRVSETNRAWLWPESTDPEWQTPRALTHDTGQQKLELPGLVIAAYQVL